MKNKLVKKPARNRLTIENDGPRIVASNFWDQPDAVSAMALSVKDDCFRLLISEAKGSLYASEMSAATHVIITRPPRTPCRYSGLMLELMFEDGSAEPCHIFLDEDNLPFCRRLPGPKSVGKKFSFKMYTGPCDCPTLLLELPARLWIEPEPLIGHDTPRVTYREVKAT